MFKNREGRKPNFIAVGVFVGLAIGVAISMLMGSLGDDSFLPIGIGAGMAVDAGVSAFFERRRQEG
ncbi:MAG: hypothetical protein KC421_11630 [Anaerolineales bacterium]|nr:hypothetical protein [Anaerolineales bacterium]